MMYMIIPVDFLSPTHPQFVERANGLARSVEERNHLDSWAFSPNGLANRIRFVPELDAVAQVLRNHIQVLEAAMGECCTDVAATGDITNLRRRLLDINKIATQAIRAPLDVPFSARG